MITLPCSPTSEHQVSLSAEKLAEIGRQAGCREIEAAQAAGLPVTGVRDGWVLRVWPDGREERLAPASD